MSNNHDLFQTLHALILKQGTDRIVDALKDSIAIVPNELRAPITIHLVAIMNAAAMSATAGLLDIEIPKLSSDRTLELRRLSALIVFHHALEHLSLYAIVQIAVADYLKRYGTMTTLGEQLIAKLDKTITDLQHETQKRGA